MQPLRQDVADFGCVPLLSSFSGQTLGGSQDVSYVAIAAGRGDLRLRSLKAAQLHSRLRFSLLPRLFDPVLKFVFQRIESFCITFVNTRLQ